MACRRPDRHDGIRVHRIIFSDVVARTPFFSRLPDPSLQGEGEAVQGYYRVDAMCRRDHCRPVAS